MTKNEMDYLTSEEKASEVKKWERLLQCEAWVGDAEGCVMLKSYGTVVATYIVAEQILLSRGRYSMTTYQHVRKFRNEMGKRFNVAPWNIEEINAEIDDWFDRPKKKRRERA